MPKKPPKLQTAIREALAEQARLEAIGVVGFTPPRPKKLKPGKMAMPDGPPSDGLEGLDADGRETIIAARNAPPPFSINDEPLTTAPSAQAVAAALKKYKAAQSKMRAARREMEKLKPLVRDLAFEYWLRRYVVSADNRREWTRSTLLFENYCKHAAECGANRGETDILNEELASETRFGILLREAGFKSERRSRPDGNYYPLRLKQGA
ncbi:hypothetical protein [Sphingobium sp. B2]|uniref:hypothetical protein n=1 Tax=Sphingobium sp. B2 TaxID=2583228 RepID=UPI0011A30684|nr:hypothetical protein [Sphingobium sp. B2]